MADIVDSTMFFSDHESQDAGSESEATELEDIPFLPTPERTSLSMTSNEGQLPSIEPTSVITEHNHNTSFRPEWDTPKLRNHNKGFNKIRQIKIEDSETDTKNEANETIAGNDSQSLRPECENSAGSVKIKTEKKSIPSKRNSHKHSLGLSMSKNAVDFRQRKVVEKQYQERLAEMLDSDIVQQVDEEGGITPLGRVFKAGVRVMERVQQERSCQRVLPPGAKISDAEVSAAEFELMRQRALKAEEKLRQYQSALRALLKDE